MYQIPRSQTRNQPEREFQKEVVIKLRELLAPSVILTAIQVNTGASYRFASFYKAMGYMPGMPDLIIFAPGPKVLGLELKVKGRKMRHGQEYIRDTLVEGGYAFATCQTWRQVRHAIWRYEIPIRELTNIEPERAQPQSYQN